MASPVSQLLSYFPDFALVPAKDFPQTYAQSNYAALLKSYYAESGASTDSFTYRAAEFLVNNVIPFVHILNVIFFVIGFCMVLLGFNRLRQHANGGGGQRVSAIGTFFYFVSGVVLMYYLPLVAAFSNSLFGHMGVSIFQQDQSVLFYVDAINNTSGADAYNMVLSDVCFALLMVVGLFSFGRGMALLVKIGEGSQESSIGKALTHVFAGLVGINGQAAWRLLNSIVPVSNY